MTKATSYTDEVIDDGAPWYAVKLFTLKLEEVRTYFKSHNLESFVPEQYVDIEGRDGKPHTVLRPVVRNLIFVKKPGEEITMRKFLSSDEAQMKAGDEVLVKFGPLKGMTGRLVRSSKKYYLLKEIPGIGVMLKVSRWCCVPMEGK